MTGRRWKKNTVRKELAISMAGAWIATRMARKAMMIRLKQLIRAAATRQVALAEGCVVPESARCVQCGICSYSCPIGIDVRRFAWEGKAIRESQCLTCGECVARCPRGVLRFERIPLLEGSVKN
jgi:ferredoxin